MKKIIVDKRGITLVALVVTIVILLILAAISLSLVLGNNGIIAKATDASFKTKEATDNDTQELNDGSDWIDQKLEEKAVQLDKTLPSTTETVPYLPTNCSHITGTTFDTGLVMQDSKENQYVWVEVPKTTEVYQTAGLTIADFTDDNYKNIENDLHTYTSAYREAGYTDKCYSTDQTGLTSDQYNELKKKMLKSVYQNGGFWIGRYEVGDSTSTANNTPRTSSSGITDKAVIIEGQDPYDYVTCSQAENLAQNFNPDNSKYNTSILFGVQWDLVLKYLETKGVSQSNLNSDSTAWGNYENSNFDITKGRYNEVASDWTLTTWNKVNDKYTKANDSDILLSTGATDRNSKQGIYDLAGNAWEWTLEYSSGSICPCTKRGGYYILVTGSSSPASNHNFDSTDNSGNYIGFRVALY